MQMLLFLALAALLIGLSKGGLGGPVPVSLTAPLLSLVLPEAKEAVGIVLPLLLFADLFALYFYRGQWDMAYVRLMLPAGIVGVVFGTLLLAVLPKEAFLQVLGLFTLLAVLYKLSSDWIKALAYRPRRWHGVFAGGASGFGSALANVGAPPFTAYMLLQPGMTPLKFIGTTTLYFAIINALKLPGFVLSGVLNAQQALLIVLVLPIVPVGVWAGRRALPYINPRLFEGSLLLLLFILSLVLIF
ncbi:MAG: sulfite exporter TauE/SafE family protein [Anaerolineae bacterium]|jgi:hypothetical protein|nr:sulfite exporter TauE/SafE family protein [Anaerolineae bacterium]